MNRIGFMVAVAACSLLASCGGDKEAKDANITLEMMVGDQSLQLNQTYTINDVDIQFINAQFYVGDMTFSISDGSSFASQEDSRYQLITPGSTNYNFSIPYTEDAPDVSLDQVSFILGVDATTNAQDEQSFDMRPEGDPLGAQNPTMHWGWLGQYRFVSIDANADLDGDGEFETPLVYHIGKDSNLGNVALMPSLELEEGKNDIRIKADVAKLLAGVDFATEPFTKSGADVQTLTDKIVANYQSTFTIEK